jgi:Glucosamine-6-phosphate isomerases/6-phosphogluconolactonase
METFKRGGFGHPNVSFPLRNA